MTRVRSSDQCTRSNRSESIRRNSGVELIQGSNSCSYLRPMLQDSSIEVNVLKDRHVVSFTLEQVTPHMHRINGSHASHGSHAAFTPAGNGAHVSLRCCLLRTQIGNNTNTPHASLAFSWQVVQLYSARILVQQYSNCRVQSAHRLTTHLSIAYLCHRQ